MFTLYKGLVKVLKPVPPMLLAASAVKLIVPLLCKKLPELENKPEMDMVPE